MQCNVLIRLNDSQQCRFEAAVLGQRHRLESRQTNLEQGQPARRTERVDAGIHGIE